MAAQQFNIAKGRVNELAKRVVDGDPSTCRLVIALYKTVEVATTLITRTTKTLVDANNTECDFDNYTTDGEILTTVAYAVDGAGKGWVDADNLQWASAGGTTDNSIAKAILYYAADTASMGAAIPLAWYTFVITTKGVDLDLIIPATGLSIN